VIIGGCEDNEELVAKAAVDSVDPDRWWDEFGALQDRIRPRFARYEPARHAGGLMHGLLSGLDRKNCWTIAEQRGDVSPSEVSGRFCRNYLAGLTAWVLAVVATPVRSA